MPHASDIMDNYLDEVRAKAKSASADELFQRLATEKQIQDVLLRLSGEYGFRFIQDRRIDPDQTSADFVLQFENYEARIEIQYESDGRPRLNMRDLDRYRDLMEKNDLTEAVIIVWATSDLSSIVLTLPQFQHLQTNPSLVEDIVQGAKPLADTITRFAESQTPHWSLPSDKIVPKQALLDTPAIFARAFRSALESESKRSFLIPEKRIAAGGLGQREVQQFEGLLRRAASGADTDELELELSGIIRGNT